MKRRMRKNKTTANRKRRKKRRRVRIMEKGESRIRTNISEAPFMVRVPTWMESGRAIANQWTD